MVSRKLQYFVALVCVVLLAVPPAYATTRKGDKLLKLALASENAKDYDQALRYLEQAIQTAPQEPAYLVPEQRIRFKAAQTHITDGRKLQHEQKLDEAMLEFQKAYLADASSAVALQEIRNTDAMIRERAKMPAGSVILTPAQRARADVEKRLNSLEGPPTLQPIDGHIHNLRMNAQPARVLYETVGKLAGINVLFDPAGFESSPGKTYNLDLTNSTLEEALDYVALESHTFWKAISRNAIFVTQDTEQKRLEYQDEIVKVFYLQNISTAQEFTEIFNAIRTATGVNKGLYQVASQNAIVFRASTDTIAVAEKVIHDLDRPKPEVVVDVIVMEVSKTRMSTLGAGLGGTGGLSTAIAFTPRNAITTGTTTTGTTTGTGTSTGAGTTSAGTTGSGSVSTGTTGGTTTGTTTGTGTGTGTGTTTNGITLGQLGHLSSADFSVNVPGALLQAMLTDSSSRILQRPQVRATDGGEAVLTIGQKIPYVSGSLNSTVATSVPYSTTQFQQVDVGVKIDMKPKVNGPEDVSMHIKVEISSVIQQILIAGVQQPEIGQKVNEADLRMRDGEVSLIGGLTDDENSLSSTGIPGVTNIPVLGYLFGTKTRNTNKDSIVIALIPHIIRTPDLSAQSEQGIFSGTDRNNKVMRRTADQSATSVAGSSSSPGSTPTSPSPSSPTQYPPVPQAVQPNQQRLPQGQPTQGQPTIPGPVQQTVPETNGLSPAPPTDGTAAAAPTTTGSTPGAARPGMVPPGFTPATNVQPAPKPTTPAAPATPVPHQ